jgi:hypothetical protein
MKSFKEYLMEGSGGVQRLYRKILSNKRASLAASDQAIQNEILAGAASEKPELAGDVRRARAESDLLADFAKYMDSAGDQYKGRFITRGERVFSRPAPDPSPGNMSALQRSIGLKRLQTARKRMNREKIPESEKFTPNESSFLSITDLIQKMSNIDALEAAGDAREKARQILRKMRQ